MIFHALAALCVVGAIGSQNWAINARVCCDLCVVIVCFTFVCVCALGKKKDAVTPLPDMNCPANRLISIQARLKTGKNSKPTHQEKFKNNFPRDGK